MYIQIISRVLRLVEPQIICAIASALGSLVEPWNNCLISNFVTVIKVDLPLLSPF
jgi:hypothetical protein